MFQFQIPQFIRAEMLDRRLAQGWFRTGPMLFRAEMLPLDEGIYSLVHVRLPIAEELPSRSRRRLLRRNRARFQLQIGPARVDDARRRLYELTKPRFTSVVASDLEPLVLGDPPGVFDTRECTVRDGDRLVAVSYFDVGRDSVASLLGLHDPEYARWSLGTYTLLEEIEHGRERGARFFYPGYVIPGLPVMDYKLRIGAVQYLEGKRWRRRSVPPERGRAADRYNGRMQTLARALTREGVAFDARLYPGFWLGYVTELVSMDLLRGLMLFRLGDPEREDELLLAEYSIEDGTFRICRASDELDIDLTDGYEWPATLAGTHELRALRCKEELFRSRSVQEVARAAREWVA